MENGKSENKLQGGLFSIICKHPRKREGRTVLNHFSMNFPYLWKAWGKDERSVMENLA